MANLSSKVTPSGVATAAQGAKADTAVQPNDNITLGNVTLGAVTATSFAGDGSGITNLPVSPSGQQEFIASGTIATGDIVKVNTDGTVSVLSPLLGDATETPLSSYSYNTSVGHYDAVSQTVVYAWGLNGGNLYVVSGTISGDVITFGSTVTVASNVYVSHGLPFAFNRSGGYSAIGYKTNGNNNTVYIRPFLVSGTTITLGSAGSFSTTYGYSFRAEIDDANGMLITWAEAQSPYGRKALALQITSSISYGGVYNLSEYVDQLAYSSTSSRFFFRINNGSTQTYQSASLSGTSLSFGGSAQTTDLQVQGSVFLKDLNSIVAYNRVEDAAYIATLSGSTVTVGSKITNVFGGSFDSIFMHQYTGTSFVASVKNGSTIELIIASVSGNTITVTDRKEVPSTYSNLKVASDTGTLFSLSSVIQSIYLDGSTSDSFVGYAASNATDTNPVQVVVSGGVVENLSGLTVGVKYGLASKFNASLVEEGVNTVGIALASDKLLLTDIYRSTDYVEELASIPWVSGTTIQATNLDFSKYKFVFVSASTQASSSAVAKINNIDCTSYVSGTNFSALFGVDLPGLVSSSQVFNSIVPTSNTTAISKGTTSLSLYHQYLTGGHLRIWGIK